MGILCKQDFLRATDLLDIAGDTISQGWEEAN